MSYSRPYLPPHEPGEGRVATKAAKSVALRARIVELEGKLAEAKADATEAWSVIAWLARQDTFSPGGEYVQIARRAEDARPASVQALLRLVETVGTELKAEEAWHYALGQDAIDATFGVLERARDEKEAAYHALLAARAGRGEGR